MNLLLKILHMNSAPNLHKVLLHRNSCPNYSKIVPSDRFVRDSDANSLNYYSSIKQLQFIKRITDHMMITKLNNVNP